ncbi:MAG TPA: nodulation protein NfeD [Thermoprotei archaeon]|nr:NfeD family protein [TACK group archaeon]HEV51244.1 nodulation protein NfeD [Thermoprotei archaeon]
MKIVFVLAMMLLFGVFCFAASAMSVGQQVYGISMNMEINPASQDYLINNINVAEASGYRYFILEITTPGGDSSNMLNMISAIDNYESNYNGTFIVYGISPGVFSAGSLISEAANYIYLQNGSSFGGASPIFSTPEPTYVVQKIMGAYSEMVSSEAALHGRNGTAAGMMVSANVNKTEGGLTYTWQQAISLHVVNGYASNLTQLISMLKSEGIIPPQASVNIVGPSLADQFRYDLSNSTLDALLLDLGFFAILIDLYHPTGILTVVGLVSLALGLYGMGIVGASPIAIILFAIAGAFMFLELKAGHGLFAASGVIISLAALLMLYGEVVIPSVHESPSAPGYFSSQPAFTVVTGVEFGFLAAALGFAVFYLDKVRQALRAKPKLIDNERLIGLTGRASEDFRDGKGTVIVSSEEWSAISSDVIKKGDRVRVTGVNGIILRVEKLAEDSGG